MPSLGADMESGTVVEWRVKPGDVVRRGDIMAVVETEKSTIEIETFESGTVDKLLVRPGERVSVGALLAHLGTAPQARSTRREAKPRPVGTGDHGRKRQSQVAPEATVEPSPVVRRLAEELGIDLHQVRGSGPGGRVVRADVERAARNARAALGSAPSGNGNGGERVLRPTRPNEPRARSSPYARRLATARGVDLSSVQGSGPMGAVVARDLEGLPSAGPTSANHRASEREDRAGRSTRGAIGELMARSKREIPHYYLSTTIDLLSAISFVEQENQDRAPAQRLLFPALALRAAALAARAVPEMNGHFLDGSFRPCERVHLGVAVSLRDGGIVAPAIVDADRLGLDDLMASLRDLVGRARRAALRSSQVSEPTITVTNLGDLGVEAVFGVIYPPQVALVGFGKVSERPIAIDGMLAVRPCVTATLSADHRASDGLQGARFLSEIASLLQRPERL